MKKITPKYKEFLAEQGYATTFPKKNARVLFNTKQGKIEDLIVEEFENPEEKQSLYKKYQLDFGNCLSDWCDWELSDVLLKIFFSYQVPVQLRKKVLFELSRVQEWRPHLAFWIWRKFNPYA